MSSRILIIEDEEAIADLEKDYLELSDFEVEIQNTGDGGLKAALEKDFNLIILDLMLPGVDGFEDYAVCLSLQHAICGIALNDGQTDLVCADSPETDALQQRGEFQKIGFPSREGLQVRVCCGSSEQVCQGLQYHAQVLGGDSGFGA